MPSKKKKYNSRFPPARIKKIMQSDEEVGKVAQVVPVIISKALEIFVASLLQSSSDITRSRNARTLTPNHIKQSILSADQFKFLREIAQTIPDVNPGAEGDDTEEGGAVGGAQPTGHSLQRKVSENRTITATSSSGHQLSAAGQTAAIGFRGRGRPRKRLIPESQSSLRSMTSTEELEDDEETEEEDEEDEDEEEEPQQSLNSDNNGNNSNNQQIISNNNNSNSSNNYNVINANHYYSSTQPTPPSPYVSTIQHSMSVSSSAAASLTPSAPVLEEDDDYDN